jgi:hypothetical protein
MPRHKWTSETARAAGKKGSNQQKAKHWEQLRDFMIEGGSKRVMEYLNNLEDDEEFFNKYERLLNYFAPKLASAQLKQDVQVKGEVEIQLKEPNWEIEQS